MKRILEKLPIVGIFAGAAAISAGIAAFSIPAGLIAAGALLIAISVFSVIGDDEK